MLRAPVNYIVHHSETGHAQIMGYKKQHFRSTVAFYDANGYFQKFLLNLISASPCPWSWFSDKQRCFLYKI